MLKLGKTVSIMGRVWQLSTTMSTTTKTMAKTTTLFFTIQKKSKLSSYVVAAGIQYGMGENLLHYFFKVHLNYVTETLLFYQYFDGCSLSHSFLWLDSSRRLGWESFQELLFLGLAQMLSLLFMSMTLQGLYFSMCPFDCLDVQLLLI